MSISVSRRTESSASSIHRTMKTPLTFVLNNTYEIRLLAFDSGIPSRVRPPAGKDRDQTGERIGPGQR